MATNKIEVIVAFSNNLISYGLSTLIGKTSSIVVTEILSCDRSYSANNFMAFKDSIILTDFQTLFNSFPAPQSVDKWPKIILLDTNCGRDIIISAFLKKKVCGVLNVDSTYELLTKAIKKVADGEVWICNNVVKDLTSGVTLGKNRALSLLTAREKEIVDLAGKGLKNEEIAASLHISKLTVKSHLYNIFQRLNLKTRFELIVYCHKYG